MSSKSFSISCNTVQFQLDNGLVVIFKPIPSALVSVQLAVRTGSKDEGEHLGRGLSHYLEHLLFKGTKKRMGEQIDAEIEAAGGRHNAYTSWEHTVYYVSGVVEGLETYLDVLSDMAFQSLLSKDSLVSEADVIRQEMKLYHDEPWDVLGRMSLWALLKKSPLRYPIIGFESAFNHIQREDLWAYYKRRYVPNNMVLLIAGGASLEVVKAWVDRYFAFVPKGNDVDSTPSFEMPLFREQKLKIEGPQQHVYGTLDYPVPHLRSSYIEPLAALALALGAGESSILWQEIREKQALVPAISAHYSRLGEQGLMSISYICEPSKGLCVEKAISTLMLDVQKNGISLPLLERVKRQAKLAMLNKLKTVGGQARNLLSNYLVYGDIAYSEGYYERLTQLSLDQVNEAAALFLKPWNAFWAILSPGNNRPVLDQEPKSLKIEEGLAASSEEQKRLEALFRPDTSFKLPNRHAFLNELDEKFSTTKKPEYPLFECANIESDVVTYMQGGDALPMLSFSFAFRAGVLAEVEDKYGMTVLLGRFLRRAQPALIKSMEALGGALSDTQDGYGLYFNLSILKEDAREALALLKRMFLWPQGKELHSIFQREKTSLLEEIKNSLDDIETFAFWQTRRLGFGNYPYRLPILGDLETVNRIQLEDLEIFFKQLCLSKNACLTVSGQCEDPALKKDLQDLLQVIPTGKGTWKDSLFVPAKMTEERYTLPGRNQAFLCQAYPILGAICQDKERYVRDVILEMMGTMASPLFKSLRDQGLVYSAGATILGGWSHSLWTFYAGTAPNEEHRIYAAFESEVKRLQSALVDKEELDRAKRGLFLAHESALQDMKNRAFGAAHFILLGFGPNGWADYQEKVEAVCLEDIAAFAKKYFNPDHRQRVCVEPS